MKHFILRGVTPKMYPELSTAEIFHLKKMIETPIITLGKFYYLLHHSHP